MPPSAEALAIINFFINSSLFMREQRYFSLIVSMYARRDNANKEIIDTLSPFVVNFEDIFSDFENMFGSYGWEEVLFSEYYAIVHYCYSEIKNRSITSNIEESLHVPQDLIELCVKAVDCKSGSKVFLPYAGNCDFAYYLENCICEGFECSQKTWAFQQIILDAYNNSTRIKRSTSMVPSFDGTSKQYDYVFTMPPYLSGRATGYMINSFITMLDYVVKDGGAMCLIVPTAIATSRNWMRFRQFIIERCNTYSLASIALPKHIVSQLSVDLCLLVIQKNNTTNGNVLMVNGNHPDMYIVDKVSHRISLKVDSILESIEKADNRISRLIPFSKLGEDILLTAERYFADEGIREVKDGEQRVKLSALIEIIPMRPRNENLSTGKIIGMRELSDNYLTSELDINTIPEDDITSNYVSSTAIGCLAGFIGGKFKVGYFAEKDCNTSVFFRREIIQFRMRPDAIATRDFLFRELMAEYVQRQAERMSKGATITRISKEDFLSLEIIVPIIKEQQDSLVFSDGLAGMSAEDRARIKAQADFRKDIHMKKHAIGQTVFNLGNWLNNLTYARKASNGIIDENAEIGGLVKIKVSDIFDNIDAAMKVLTHQIQTFDVSYGMKSENFSIADFLDEYLASHQHSHVLFDFDSSFDRMKEDVPFVEFDDTDPNPTNWKTMSHPGEFIARTGDPITYIEFPKDALTIILDNIISNAVVHGFTNAEKEYTIRFRFESKGSKVILSISNNGDPLPAGLDSESVFVYGETSGDTRSHYGIGGYQVKNLMKEFDGDAEIISTPEEEFTVTYNLIFGNNNIVDLDIE